MNLTIAFDDATARAALEKAATRAPAAMQAAMFRRGQDLLDLAVPLTPSRSGRLRASRYCTRTDPVETGFSAPYAAAVHEKNVAHPVGQWKFHETALLKIESQGITPLEQHFAEAFERGETLASAPARHPEQGNGGVATRARPTAARRGGR